MLLSVALTGCGGDESNGGSSAAACTPADGPVTLEFSTWIPGIEDVVAIWNDANPDIQVTVNSVPGGANGTYENFSNAIRAQDTPDLGQFEYYALPTFRVQGGLRDIAQCAGVADAASQFADALWEQVQLGDSDSVFAIPMDTGTMGMYYRADLFEQHDIAVPTTWEEFADAAAQISELGASITNFSVSSGEIPPFVGLVAQAGGSWFGVEDDAWTVDLTDDASTKVAEFWQGLLDDGLVSTVPGFTDSWNHAYNTGEVWTWFSGAWGANGIMALTDTEGDWRVAPLPTWNAGESVSAPWGGSTTAVFEYSEHPYEAAQFALWLNTSEEALNAMVELGQFPANSTAGDKVDAIHEEFEFFGGQRIFADFLGWGDDSASFTWGPTMTQVFADVSDGFSAAIAGNGTLMDALESAQTSTIGALNSAGIPVRE